MTTLFLASTPRHSFLSLGLAHGPYAGARYTLALIDQRAGDRDFVAEAIARRGVEVRRFARIGKSFDAKLRNGRRVLGQVAELARRLQPDCVVAGNDRRAEFHAALAAVTTAKGIYVDDGFDSYVPLSAAAPSPAMRRLGDLGRRLVYGIATEHPHCVGSARSTRGAWVMLPDLVHPGLRSKQVQRIDPAWFRTAAVSAIWADAIALAGVDVERVRRARLLLLLPHDSVLRAQPRIAEQVLALARRQLGAGQLVAFKYHPRSRAEAWLPPGCIEIPRRLPVEVLAPLLGDTLVAGPLTTAMISLKHFGEHIRVQTLSSAALSPTTAAIYAAVGIEALPATD